MIFFFILFFWKGYTHALEMIQSSIVHERGCINTCVTATCSIIELTPLVHITSDRVSGVNGVTRKKTEYGRIKTNFGEK